MDNLDLVFKNKKELYNNIEIELMFASKEQIADGKIPGLELSDPKRFFALYRPDYWNIPLWGSSLSGVKEQTQLLVVEHQDKSVTILIPLVDKENRTTLAFCDNSVAAVFDGTLSGHETEDTLVLAKTTGDDAFALMHTMMEYLSVHCGNFRCRGDKERPDFMEYLGWCTWDAFYHSVDFGKIKDGLQSFKEKGIRLGYMILDDGGLDVTGDFLNSFYADTGKFPGGFSAVSSMAKQEYGVKYFGLWHAFEGYWAGLNPEGRLAEKYGMIKNENILRPWLEPYGKDKLYLCDPDYVEEFFEDFYSQLEKDGIDMLKVDGQCALELFTHQKLGRADTMAKFQAAYQNAAKKHFGDANVIACMCNGSDIYFNFYDLNVWRNSIDYFPNKPFEDQGNHLITNAYNSFLSSHFAWPDWDMFQSHTPEAKYHAAARAISGGPVYICDLPGKQDSALIHSIAYPDGRIPRFDRPVSITKDLLFTDIRNEKVLLKLTNVKGANGTIGVFHCSPDSGELSTTISPSEIPEFSEETMYVIYDVDDKNYCVAGLHDTIPVALGEMNAKIFVISPISEGFAAIGLEGKYSAAATVTAASVCSTGFCASFDGVGKAVFYTSSAPSKVLINGEVELKNKWIDYNNAILTVDLAGYDPEERSRPSIALIK